MRASVNGTNNGNISATFSDMKHSGWRSSATLAKALYELRALGFIAVTREGGLRMGTRVCTLYRFTDLETLEQPKVGVSYCKATHDYRRLATVRDAERALIEGTKKLRAEGAKKQAPKKSPVHKTMGSGSIIEPDANFIAFENEQASAVSH
ncbi:hypothetical protein K8O84_03060 [Cupriavidus pauculus]|nr:hypothetical protein F7R19_28570 [Cupriavidus pauculus]UAL01512.1 hypothetical protein K8O84_03060 [Cupriavidus pauculus]